MNLCMFVCMHICMFICMYLCMHVYASPKSSSHHGKVHVSLDPRQKRCLE